MPSIQVYDWKLFLKDHNYVFWTPNPKSPAENGIPKKSLDTLLIYGRLIILNSWFTANQSINQLLNQNQFLFYQWDI